MCKGEGEGANGDRGHPNKQKYLLGYIRHGT